MQNENNSNIEICQSCGMPMLASEHFGTKKDSTLEKEYCCFCFQNGIFTDNLSVYEYAIGNVQIPEDILNEKEFSASNYELILQEAVKLQKLKRWRTHVIHQDYYTSVYRVLEYIRQNLKAFLDLDKLSEIANISKFHFHRIFKAILNESPGEYIQRLKLEKVAFKLHTTESLLKEIAEEVGYQSAESLSKAFKKQYGINPTEFRKNPSDLTRSIVKPLGDTMITPEIKIISDVQLLCVQVENIFTDVSAFNKAWNVLNTFVSKNYDSYPVKGQYCLSRDISTHTAPDKCRIYIGVEVSVTIKPIGKCSIQKLEGGKYAIFRYSGSQSDLETIYCNIYRYWIPKSRFTLRDSLHFEKYLENEPTIEIYIPIE